MAPIRRKGKKKQKQTIDLKVFGWKKLSYKQQREVASWVTELVWHLVEVGDAVHDEFTGSYP